MVARGAAERRGLLSPALQFGVSSGTPHPVPRLIWPPAFTAARRVIWPTHAAVAGEEVIIANRGEPVAKLVPARGQHNRPGLGSARAILDWLAANPLPPYRRRTAKEIEAAIAEERAGWD